MTGINGMRNRQAGRAAGTDIHKAVRGGGNSSVFSRRKEAIRTPAFSPEERKQYEHDMMTENDYRNTIEFAKDKAREEGMRRGLDEGIEKGLVTAARNLKKMGMETNAIIQATGLSETVIRNL